MILEPDLWAEVQGKPPPEFSPPKRKQTKDLWVHHALSPCFLGSFVCTSESWHGSHRKQATNGAGAMGRAWSLALQSGCGRGHRARLGAFPFILISVAA